MISYGNPICAVTNNRASLFCLAQGCTKPAFACGQPCLYQEGHFENGTLHQTMQWRDIEEPVRLIIERPLSKEELVNLERQQKQLKIITQELKVLRSRHQKALREYKGRLYIKGIAQRVLNAIQGKVTNKVTGGNMAHLIEAIRKDDLFSNQKAVNAAIQQRNIQVDELLTKMRALIDESKEQQGSLKRPDQIPSFDEITKIIPTVDVTNSSMAVVNNGLLTVRIVSNAGVYPVFACEQLADGQSFTVEIVDFTMKFFMIGVATSSLRNIKNQISAPNSMCINTYGMLYSDGAQQKHSFELNIKDKVTVQRSSQRIEWIRDDQILCSTQIPNRLREVPLFPVLWIGSGIFGMIIPKLRFV